MCSVKSVFQLNFSFLNPIHSTKSLFSNLFIYQLLIKWNYWFFRIYIINFIFWQLYLFLILNSKIIKSNLLNSHLMRWRVFSQLIISGLCIEKLWVFPLIPDWSNRRKIRKFDVVWRNWMIREHWFEFIGTIETEVEVVRENCPTSKFETG